MGFETGLSYMITYILTLMFTFLGVYVGAILAFIAPEELKPGKLYFKAFMNTILVFIFMILLYAYGANLFILIVLGVVASLFLYFTSEITPINQIAYFFLGVVYYFSTLTMDLFIVISSMIFIYGLPLGSMYVARRLKMSKKTLLTDVLLSFGFYVIIALMTNLIALYTMNL